MEIDKKNKLKQITWYLFTQEHQLMDFKLKLVFWNNNTHTGLKPDAGMLHFKHIQHILNIQKMRKELLQTKN